MPLSIATFVTTTAMVKKRDSVDATLFYIDSTEMDGESLLKPSWPVRYSMESLKRQRATPSMTMIATTPTRAVPQIYRAVHHRCGREL